MAFIWSRVTSLGLYRNWVPFASAGCRYSSSTPAHSLTINENADPDVRVDFETAMNHAVPETLPYVHTLEGPDDMPAHVKSSMMGSSVMIPIGDGRLATRHVAGNLPVRASRPSGGPSVGDHVARANRSRPRLIYSKIISSTVIPPGIIGKTCSW